jgi:hypothetical protein
MKSLALILAFISLTFLPIEGTTCAAINSTLTTRINLSESNTSSADTVLKGQRNYGSFVIVYSVTDSGYKVNCSLVLANSLAGLSTLTNTAPNYLFNTIVNKNKAYGILTAYYYPTNQVSTLEGDFYVISERSDTIRFKGTVAGWYTRQQTAPKN